MNRHSIRFRLTIWYAGLLAGLLLVFGGSTWFGLAHYLNRSLGESLGKQARQIGENYLLDVQIITRNFVNNKLVTLYGKFEIIEVSSPQRRRER